MDEDLVIGVPVSSKEQDLARLTDMLSEDIKQGNIGCIQVYTVTDTKPSDLKQIQLLK